MDTLEGDQGLERLFLGISLPEAARNVLGKSVRKFEGQHLQLVPEEKWHLTLLWLGECPPIQGYLSRITKPLPQAFLPTVHVTHVGKGLAPHHIWAFVTSTPVLEKIRSDMSERLRKMRLLAPGLKQTKAFVPHIHVAVTMADKGKQAMMADEMAEITFPVKDITLFQSVKDGETTKYIERGRIPLTAS